VGVFCQRLRGSCADPLGGAVGRGERGKLALQLGQLAEKPVVLGVGKLGLVGDVVELIGPLGGGAGNGALVSPGLRRSIP
jgi:hypothetical protein